MAPALYACGRLQIDWTAGRERTVTFTVRGTDVNGCFAERTFTMVIVAVVPTLPVAAVVLLAVGLLGLGFYRRRSVREA